MRVSEPVSVDLSKRVGISVGGELVGHRNRVVSKALHAAGNLWTAGVETEDRGDDRIESLRLCGVARIRSAAVAEPVVAAAGVQQAVVRISGLGGRIELHGAHR